MKAQLVNDHTNKRVPLHEAVPLKTPFSVYIWASALCNFKCKYCLQSQSNETLERLKKESPFMSLETVDNFISGCAQFPDKIKMLTIASVGEPLLNPDIGKIVKRLKSSGIADEVSLVTNGSPLTPKISDELIDAGLDLLRISIQGLNSERYTEMSGVKVDFNRLVDNISYFAAHKKNTTLYIKIMREELVDEEEERRFFEKFGDMCDKIAIERLVNFTSRGGGQRFQEDTLYQNLDATINGYAAKTDLKVCFLPFFSLALMPNGQVATCCSVEYMTVLGDIYNESFYAIYNGDKRRGLLMDFLNNGKQNIKPCALCNMPNSLLRPEDDLDPYIDEIKARMDGL